MTPIKLAPHVHQISLGFVNAYAVTTPEDDWVLIDTGIKPNLSALKTLETHFGKPPVAILLTHGHSDHVGTAGELASLWNIKIYCHKLERPFLVGKSTYPPPDPTVGGVFALASRAMPIQMFNFTGHLETFPEGEGTPFLPDWQIIETPGHSPGHVSFWHETDRILIAGDAVSTIDVDTLKGLLSRKQQFAASGLPFNFDWNKTRHSFGVLADLEPVIVAAGHGQPIMGADTPQKLREFTHNFTPPTHGRYVQQPAETDESGVTYLPPKPDDPLGRQLTAGAALAGLAAVLTVANKAFSRRK